MTQTLFSEGVHFRLWVYDFVARRVMWAHRCEVQTGEASEKLVEVTCPRCLLYASLDKSCR